MAVLAPAIRLRPDDPDLLHSLGLAYFAAGQPRQAVAAAERAISLRPRYVEAFWALGSAKEAMGDTVGAMAALRQALDLKPSLAGARFRLARLCEEWGQTEEAIRAYKKVKSQEPNTTLGRVAEARALLLDGREDELERVLRRILAVEPGNAAAHELLGGVMANAGRFDAAAQCYERALAAAPDMVGAYYDLVRCRRITDADGPLIDRMRAGAAMPGLESSVLAKLHLAIGKAMDDLGDYAEAMSAFDAAEAARRRKLTFDLARFERRVERLISAFTEQTLAQVAKASTQTPGPILIVGLPRSGTTLCEQILSSHEEVVGAGELMFWQEKALAIEATGGPWTDPGVLEPLGAAYLQLLRRLAPDAQRVTDKLPFNFMWAGMIHLALPGAVIIHCRRGAIDVALSIHQTHFAARIDMPTGGEALVAYIRGYERLMAHWRRVLPADRFIEVDYEALCAAPEPEIRRMLAAAGLAWSPACLRPELNTAPIRTPSKWQARQPINTAAVERWRRYQPYLGPLAALAPEAE